MNIAGREIGPAHPPYVVAEIGLNHGGDYVIAKAMIMEAKIAGASCVKFQTHCADEFCETPAYPSNAGGESIQDFVRRCYLSDADEQRLFYIAKEIGIDFLSTPFSPMAVDRLERLGVAAYKVGSGHLTDLPFLRLVASKGKPVILSTGMGTMRDVFAAVDCLGPDTAVLHCTSNYPTEFKDVRLGAMTHMAKHLPKHLVGLSDHTGSIWPSLGAVALGASILEVHLKIDSCPPGPDIAVSVTPNELCDLVTGSKAIWEARGGTKDVLAGEAATKAWFQASRRIA